MHLFRALALSLILAAAPVLRSEVANPALEKLQSELGRYFAGLKGDKHAAPGSYPATMVQERVAGIGAAIDAGNFDAADQSLREIQQVIPDPTVNSLVAELLAANQAARHKADEAVLARADALLARTADTCLKAKSERDLDQLQLDLVQAKNALPRSYGEATQRASAKLESALMFARRWQDYLVQVEAGDTNSAARIMAELANQPGYPVLPRSELLERARPPKAEAPAVPAPAPAVALEVKSLDDIPAALEKLQAGASGRNASPDLQGSIYQLNLISGGVSALAAGNINDALQAVTNTGSSYGPVSPRNSVIFADLRRQLVLRIIPRYLDLPESLLPRPDENPIDYFQRAARQAKADRNWMLLSRLYEAYARVGFGNALQPEWLQNSRAALRAFITATNQEKAGDLAAAANSYATAVGIPTSDIPLDEIAEHAKAVRKARDEELERARARQRAEAEAQQRRIHDGQP